MMAKSMAPGDAGASQNGSGQTICLEYIPKPQGISSLKAHIVDMLSELFELSPAIAKAAGRLVLGAWPRFRRA